MLKQHPDRAVTTFAVEFEPIILTEKVSSAAEVVQKRLKTPHWGLNPGGYVFRDIGQRRIVVVDFRRFMVQTLGVAAWQNGLEDLVTDFRVVLQKLGVVRLKRIGFLTQALLALGMSHREMADLMFGSYLAPAEELREVCGKVEDMLVQLHGEEGNARVQLVAAPQTQEQAVQTLLSVSNLEVFLEPRLLDTAIKDFKDRIGTDCFYVQVDLSRSDIPDSEAATFMRQSLDAADRITERAVQKLKSLRIRRGS